MIADPREIQRLRFQPGQDLLSRDFRDGAAFDLSLREWHNRALHQAFGVASGLSVKPVPDSGPPTAVEVSAGLAYDCTGRALFLTAETRVPVPSPWSGGPQLLVLGPAQEPAWIPEAGWRPDLGVPLARLKDDQGKAQWDGEFSPPRARTLARQRIASGTTVEGATAWQRWFVPGFKGLQGIEVQVNTAAAGFRHTPCYFAWVQGTILERQSAGLSQTRPLSPLHLFSHLTQASSSGFRFRVAAPFDASLDRNATFPIFTPFDVLVDARRSLAVCWIGIEMDETPEPEPKPEVPDGKP
jgi:hypothetical protein